MLRDDSLLWIVFAFMAAGCIVAILSHFTSESRLRRRRRKSHGRIVSKSRQPTVKFTVKTKN
jgi:peptidoglycan/LPS O-acetylase OafA/YrhL